MVSTRMLNRCVLVLMIGLLLWPAIAATQAKHPRLVSLEATRCQACHAKLIRGLEHVHAPVADDCTSCHEMSIGDEGTTVALAAAEPELCVMCHDTLEAAAAAELEASHAPVVDSCLSCHVPHASEQARLLASPIEELCLACHDLEELKTPHGGQLTEGVDCTSCHRPHGSDNPAMLLATTLHSPYAEGSCESCHREPYAGRIRLRARGERVCSACHGEMTEDAAEGGSVHQALVGDRTRAGCISCHNPHMSDNPGLLVQPTQELCATCHDLVAANATAATGHAPAADDCLTCHLPHSSAQVRLLTEVAPDLCTMCHDVDDADLKAAHLGADLASLDCTTCHSPHGEGHDGLLAKTVHPPVLDGCDVCHEGAADQLMEDGESALCLACHDDVGTAAEKAVVPHAALEMARCADCHNPHASAIERLLKAPGGEVCTTCHDDMVSETPEHNHGVINLIGCHACHLPHGGDEPQMLRSSGSQLCLGCHDSGQVRVEQGVEQVQVLDRFTVPAQRALAMASLNLSSDGEHNHPISGHRVLGMPTEAEKERGLSTFSGELSCASCHVPHHSASGVLLQWGADSSTQACMNCHPK